MKRENIRMKNWSLLTVCVLWSSYIKNDCISSKKKEHPQNGVLGIQTHLIKMSVGNQQMRDKHWGSPSDF